MERKGADTGSNGFLDSQAEPEAAGPFTPEEQKHIQKEILKRMRPVYDALDAWRIDSLACDITF